MSLLSDAYGVKESALDVIYAAIAFRLRVFIRALTHHSSKPNTVKIPVARGVRIHRCIVPQDLWDARPKHAVRIVANGVWIPEAMYVDSINAHRREYGDNDKFGNYAAAGVITYLAGKYGQRVGVMEAEAELRRVVPLEA